MKRVSTFRQRLAEALAAKGMRQKDLCRLTNTPTSAMSLYLSGGYEPRADRLIILAAALAVDELWLMGYDTNNDTEINQTEVREIVGELQVFNYNENQVRTVLQDGEPWFVLKDVCEVLGISDHKVAARRLEGDEVCQTPLIDSIGRKQETTIINESGLYNVILRSDKPQAKPFRKWVTAEVLPSIRKHGAYMTPETLEAAILSPDYLLKVVTALKDETDKRKALEAANSALTVDLEIARPKAQYFDELVDRNLLTNFRETAKELGIKEREFVKFLIEKKYIYRDKKGKLLPTSGKGDGLFEVKECYNDTTKWSGTQTLITPKGRETFRLLMVGC